MTSQGTFWQVVRWDRARSMRVIGTTNPTRPSRDETFPLGARVQPAERESEREEERERERERHTHTERERVCVCVLFI